MKIVTINHVQITIPVALSVEAYAFYGEFLALDEVEKPGGLRARGGYWFQVGTQQLHVSLEGGVDRLRTKAHVAYEVDDLAAWKERLLSAEIPLENQPPIPNYTRILFRDPFGNRIELLQRI